MKTATDRARELPPGPDLDALFFDTCWRWRRYRMCERTSWVRSFPCDTGSMYEWVHDLPEVSTDAAACEAWAMRWARENGFGVSASDSQRMTGNAIVGSHALLIHCGIDAIVASADGDTWWHAIVRACIVAKEQLRKEPKQ
jgi:hypothetical protein